MRKPCFMALVVVVLWMSFIQDALCIPPFARKYETSCVTCHVAYPKLTPFGEAFRRVGFQFPGDEETDLENIKEEPTSLGAEAYKRVFPKAVWPGQIPGSAPVGIRFEGMYKVQPNEAITNDFHLLNSGTVLVGGTLGRNIGFYADIHLVEHGGLGGLLNRAYIQFSDLFGKWLPHYLLNLKVGQFSVAAAPFTQHRNLLTLTPLALTTSSGEVLAAGHHGARRSLELTRRGIELDGILKHYFTYAIGVSNGNGVEESRGEIYDNNSSKDVYARLAYKFGGLGFDGYSSKGDASQEGKDYWTDNSVRIGAFGYFGDDSTAKGAVVADRHEEGEEPGHTHAPPRVAYLSPVHDEQVSEVSEMMETTAGVSDFWRLGSDLEFNVKNIDLFGAVMFGRDKLEMSGNNREFILWFVQGDYVFYPWLIGALRYEMLHPDEGEAQKRIVPHLTILPRANIKMLAETAIDLDNTDDLKLWFGIDYAF